MSIAPNQLGDIYQQLNERFQDHPLISVKPLKGDPPEHYLVTYKISGLTGNNQDNVVNSTEHTIEIAIPFGFPHFPPSCKPHSDIFHPDVDPGAIRIGYFWKEKQSLPELIIHIGQMINGEFYSTHDSFNSDAGEYYLNNNTQFPFAQISWETGDISTAPDKTVPNTATPPLSLEEHDLPLDSLDIEDMAFDLESDTIDSDSLSIESPFGMDGLDENDDPQYDIYQRKKEFFTLRKKLSELTEFSIELQKKFDETESIIQRSEKLYSNAKNQEALGNATDALNTYKEVASLVADYPAIRSDIKRLEQTIELVADLAPMGAMGGLDEPDGLNISKSSKEPKFKETKPQKTPVKKGKKKNKEPEKLNQEQPRKRSLSKSLLLIPLIAGVGAGGFFGLKLYSSMQLEKAKASLSICSNAYETQKYKEAKNSCENGLSLANKVFLLYSAEKTHIKTSLNLILNAEDLKNGLAGKVLVDGKYVSQTQAAKLIELKTLREQAETLFSQKQFDQAAVTYTQAAEIAAKLTPPAKEQQTQLLAKSNIAKFSHLTQNIEKNLLKKEWIKANTAIAEAKKLLPALPTVEEKQASDMLLLFVNRSEFGSAYETANDAMNSGEWEEATAAFNRALDISSELETISKDMTQGIKQSIERIKLYQTLEQGNDAFAIGNWDKAIKAYNSANQVLISSKYELIDKAKSDINRKKLNKIILQASIIRDQQSIKTMLSNEELRSARDAYNNLLSVIKSSGLAGENEFAKAKGDINSKIKELDKQIYIVDKKHHLETNYQTLFAEHYPNATKDNLENPAVKLVENNEKELVFKMQCTEKRSGRALTMVMYYAYNKKLDSWALSTRDY